METTEALRPGTPEEACETMRWAAASGTPLAIVGGASKQGLGPPAKAAVALKLDAITGIVTYEPEELVLTALAGTPLAAIETALAMHNQMLAFEPPDWAALLGVAGQPTLGGTVACNAAGPRRTRAGAARDHMLGVTAISGRGESFKAGGKVVKNVTGYDLPKLLAGSFGTLAVMTELTIKVMPRAEASETIMLSDLSDRAAIAVLRDAASMPYEASGLAHLPAAAAARLGLSTAATLIRLEGTAATLPHRRNAMLARLAPPARHEVLDHAQTGAVWAGIRDVRPFVGQPGVVWRVSVPPASGAPLAEQAGADAHFYDWAGGLVWLRYETPPEDGGAARLRTAIAQSGGGHATLFRAPEDLHDRVAAFEPLPTALAALSRRVKAAFDPVGILNPGRFMPPA